MLNVTNTERLMGVTISGTYDDLNQIYTAIERVIGPEESYELTILRILAVCYDLRHCFMGNREIELVDNSYYKEKQKYHGIIHSGTNVHFKVNINWIQIIFVILALDDYIKLYGDDKNFNKIMKKSEVSAKQKEYYKLRRFEDIALVRLFQEKVWKAFREACGDAAYKRLYNKAKANDKDLFNCGYLDFCTHYLDVLEIKYIYSDVEKRKKLLATLTRKIIVPGEDYYKVYDEVSSFATENNITKDKVIYRNIQFPEHIEW